MIGPGSDKKEMTILGGGRRGDLTQILDLFPLFEKFSDIFGRRCVHCTCVCDSAIICTNDCPPSTSLTWTYFFFGKKHALPAIITLNLIFHITMDNLVKKKLFSLARNGGGGVWTAIWITCAILPQREKAEVSKSCGQENNLGTRRRK